MNNVSHLHLLWAYDNGSTMDNNPTFDVCNHALQVTVTMPTETWWKMTGLALALGTVE